MSYRTEYITENGIKYEVSVHKEGTRVWRLAGEQHRENGPALECANGNRYWYLNGQLHREDGPAIVYANGDRFWYLNGKSHREAGPSAEYSTGYRAWYWHGVYLTLEVLEQGIDQLSPEEIRFWLPILAAQKSK